MLNSISLNRIANQTNSSGVVSSSNKSKDEGVSIKTGALRYGFSVIKSVFKRSENKQTKTEFMSAVKQKYSLNDKDLKAISKMISAKRGTPLSLKDAKGALSLAAKNGTERTYKKLSFENRPIFENTGSSSMQWVSGNKNEGPVFKQSEHSQILDELDKHVNELPGMSFGQTEGIKPNQDDQDSDDVLDLLLMDSKSKPLLEDQGNEVIKMLEEAMGEKPGNDLKLEIGSGKISPELGHLEGKQDVDNHEIDTNKHTAHSDQKLDEELMNLLDDLIENSNAKLNTN